MPPAQSKVAQRIDALMEKASEALVRRAYFECERLAADALRRAVAAGDFDRIARIALPLQESRRQIRDLAVDTGKVFSVSGELPMGDALAPGMYLLSPPRVGIDGRMLREEAMRREIPVVVVVREPETRAGLWPVVGVGPVTVRARISPPAAKAPRRSAKATSAEKGGKGKKAAAAKLTAENGRAKVTAEWMLLAGEALGDAAIADLPPGLSPQGRVLALAERLEAVPDHEKLHQRLEESAREAAKIPAKRATPAQRAAAARAELED